MFKYAQIVQSEQYNIMICLKNWGYVTDTYIKIKATLRFSASRGQRSVVGMIHRTDQLI